MNSQLVFRHHDGDLPFTIASGVYHLSPAGALSCSVACSPDEDNGFMGAPHFAMLHVPVGEGLHAGRTFLVPGPAAPEDVRERRPLTHLYAGQHYSPWHARLTVVAVHDGAIDVHVAFVTPDPIYYDEKAKPTDVEFRARLEAGPAAAIWNPL
jgi:hypothetical protein